MSPKVGEFEGIKVRIYFGDHGNPHVHAIYQGHEAKVYIETLAVEKCSIPAKQMKKLKAWIVDHQEVLLQTWNEIINSP
jgi:hypothetical protein